MQILIVAVLVAGCAVYALWTLMPAAARRRLARALLGLPLPGWLRARLQPAARAGSGCGCDGCDRAPKPAAGGAASAARPQVQPLTFHPRR